MANDQTYKLGIDVGGTFTDLFLWTSAGETRSFKVLSTPKDPSIGVLDGVSSVAKAMGLSQRDFAERLTAIVHGTTVTTNATLTRRGAKTGLVTTLGVRDALEMRRGIREDQYDNRLGNVLPLVPRYLRRPVRGRLDYAGRELEPLCLDDVKEAAELFRQEGVTSVAVCFMNAFVSPEHEQAAAEALRRELPEAFVSVSSEVLPAVRFYNRVSTTTLDAFVGPVLRDYLRALTGRLAEAGFRGSLLIMQSSGGVALPDATAKKPAATLLSGPAAAPRAAAAWAGPSGFEDCLVVDMGGTSFDASLVRGGSVELKAEGEIARLRIALPMLDIVTIGAGGGSIGRVDAGGLLRMGPESAGADPGPACYGRGGQLPTCTDANVVLGYLDPSYFAGGELRLDADASRTAIARHVAEPLGLDVERAAVGMYRVINSNMAHGVREITVKRGLDPREFPMVVAGGAGSLHGTAIASELDIPVVLVPPVASVLCAAGMLLTDQQHDFVRSCISELEKLPKERLQGVVGELTRHGEAQLRRADVPADRIEQRVALDLRYLKQYHEVTVPVSLDAIERGDWSSMIAAFHREHDRLYGYELSAEGTPVELINVRVKSVGRVDKPALPRLPAGTADASHARKKSRRAYVPERDQFEELSVFDGHALRAGNRISGPALIERTDTTIFVSAAYDARFDDYGTAVVERRAS
ncbi:MAG: hydantoinase/oxoprolinase family protein [Polyangiaceae bacterium]|nr:hydantoinase/oxoprolinase family protein [Polyangiaceae bacterium]MCL4749522.1 hydantoinase/oxoprolinase family protein [Myxococcales bacterium]